MTHPDPIALMDVSREIMAYLDNLTSRLEAVYGSHTAGLVASSMLVALIDTVFDMTSNEGPERVKATAATLQRIIDSKVGERLAKTLGERVTRINGR